MEFQYINETIKLLEEFLAEYGGTAVPCTIEEVEQLESMLPNSYRLPAAYREFLLYGGRKISHFYKEDSRFDYKMANFSVKNERRLVNKMMHSWDSTKEELPDDTYVLSSYMTSYFNFFKLTEGDNPPVYEWSEEEELGIEAIEKKNNSFTDFIREEIRILHHSLVFRQTEEKLKASKPPRGLQFWVPAHTEYEQGVSFERMIDYFGLVCYREIEPIAAKLGLDHYFYLEELSGWKSRKVGEKIRFFPPSDESNSQTG